jgi:uroporphyrinogen decarboxylase
MKNLKMPSIEIKPDFNELTDILKGKKMPHKVHFVELSIDEEVKSLIIESFFNEKYFSHPIVSIRAEGGLITPDTFRSEDYSRSAERYYGQVINFYHRMGFSYFPYFEYDDCFRALFCTQGATSADTAYLSRGKREWAQEGFGLIRSWDDFESFKWEDITNLLPYFENQLSYLNKILPDGMKALPTMSMFELTLEYLLGYQGLFFGMHDCPNLVRAILDKMGEITIEYYRRVSGLESVGAIWHTDDLGFKTATMISTADLRDLVFPWFKRFIEIVHSNKKQIWLHCCGYKDEIMKDLIYGLEFDALHSFEDTCCPVIEYKKKYGDEIALLGGIDMDKLVRMAEDDLRIYIRNTLDICMKGGKYALGSGNTISNYVPAENFFILLEEGINWAGRND